MGAHRCPGVPTWLKVQPQCGFTTASDSASERELERQRKNDRMVVEVPLTPRTQELNLKPQDRRSNLDIELVIILITLTVRRIVVRM